MLTVLGCYLGKIAKESMSKSAIQIIGVGVLIVIISFLMGVLSETYVTPSLVKLVVNLF